MRRIVHFVLVVPATRCAFVPGIVHVWWIDVVQGLCSVVGLDHLDRGPVLDEYTAQALANLGKLLRVRCPT
ncbi:hypothetical protein D3C73_1436720 [compost metagenome]